MYASEVFVAGEMGDYNGSRAQESGLLVLIYNELHFLFFLGI